MAKILVIDDEPSVLTALGCLLEAEGFDVVTAPDGVQGLRAVRDGSFDLVLTDVFMPEKEGFETIVELRAMRPNLPVIAMSGGGSRRKLDVLPYMKAAGACRTLAKPFQKDELVACIEEALAGAADG